MERQDREERTFSLFLSTYINRIFLAFFEAEEEIWNDRHRDGRYWAALAQVLPLHLLVLDAVSQYLAGRLSANVRFGEDRLIAQFFKKYREFWDTKGKMLNREKLLGDRSNNDIDPRPIIPDRYEGLLGFILLLESKDHYLKNVNRIIHKKYIDSIWQTSQLARDMNLSVRQLTRLVAEHTGGRYSPAKYLKTYRLYRSLALLQDKSLSIEQVANSVGFSSGQQYRRNFKKYFGRSPRDYRNAIDPSFAGQN